MNKRLVGAVQTLKNQKGRLAVSAVDTTTSTSDLNNAFPASLFRIFFYPQIVARFRLSCLLMRMGLSLALISQGTYLSKGAALSLSSRASLLHVAAAGT